MIMHDLNIVDHTNWKLLYTGIYLKTEERQKLVWKKFGEKLHMKYALLAILPVVFTTPICTLILIENQMEPVFLYLEYLFPIKNCKFIFPLMQFVYCYAVIGSIAELVQSTTIVVIFASTLYFWLSQEQVIATGAKYISWNHYRTLRILDIFGNSCINKPEVAAHHCYVGMIIVCGLARILIRGLKDGTIFLATVCSGVVAVIVVVALEAYLSQSITLTSKKRVSQFKVRFAGRSKYLKLKLRSTQFIYLKSVWICLSYYSLMDFLKYLKKCLDILLLILLIDSDI